MNWEHLKTYVWLRWRLSANQVRRSGPLGAIFAALLTVLRIFGGISTFIIGILIGMFALQHAEPKVVMVVWDGVVAGFLFFWMIGLMSELQRTELLSLDNFMHLPVSPAGAFLINYAGSSIGLSLILFLPAMTGLGIGLVISRGLFMSLLFPLIASFFLMVTAITYQFRGWLASMMTNPRRRRTIIAIISLLFITAAQLPNIINTMSSGARAKTQADRQSYKEFSKLEKDFANGQITTKEYQDKLRSKRTAWEASRKRDSERNYEITRKVNMVVPPGWLPYGAATAAQGRGLPAWAGIIGMGLIGIASLWRSYKTTIRMYTGDFDSSWNKRINETIPDDGHASTTKVTKNHATPFLERKLPWISEQASAISLMCIRSLVRAPEAKMLMLTPIIALAVFGRMLAGQWSHIPSLIRPLIALGAASFILIISMVGFLGNQFAFDRSGFRTFVLSCAPRRDILLGKNLSLFPFAFILMLVAIAACQWVNPMRMDHLAAVLIQIIPLYLLFCLAGNLLSILSPITLKPGSGQPAPHQGTRIFLQMLFMIIVPILFSLTLIPLGVEALLNLSKQTSWIPAFLVLNIIQAMIMLWIYSLGLDSQGRLLQQHEKKILEIVSSKVE
jgi:hypothetical protein